MHLGLGDSRSSWLLWNSFAADLLAGLFSLNLGSVILSDSLLEGFSALRFLDVLNSDVKSLVNDSASNLFVDNNAEGVCSNVEYSSSLSLVVFVRHSLVEGRVNFDVNEVTSLVICQDFAKREVATSSEWL